MSVTDFFMNLPEVEKPIKKVSLNNKLMWTGIVLVLYFVMSVLPLYGLSKNYVSQFESLSILLAASFGSVITLGIGPLVTGSIMLQLLTGAGIVKIDMHSSEGKKKYQGLQKLFSIFFVIFENGIYVVSGALPTAYPSTFLEILLILQLTLGGLILMLLDEVSSKWGVGSGISLFIAAGVSREIVVKGFSPIFSMDAPIGAIPQIIYFLSKGETYKIMTPFLSILATIIIFIMAIYFSGVQVNIPLSFGKVRGFGIKWPIKWFYTSNIPVILTAALMASIQFWAVTLSGFGIDILGKFEVRNELGKQVKVPISGIAYWIHNPSLTAVFQNGFNPTALIALLFYAGFMIIGAIIFAYLWLNVGKASPSDVADQILSSGLSIPGFRRDKRILEKVLERYIVPLTILGGFTVGVLALVADLLGALSRGTGILLSVMIIYQFYEQIQKAHMEEMSPLIGKILG